MIAGGTGITPMYQVAMKLLKDPEDTTQVLTKVAWSSIQHLLFDMLTTMIWNIYDCVSWCR